MTNSPDRHFLSEIGLNFDDGFGVGIVAAILLQLGAVKIQVIEQAIAIWILLALAAIVTYRKAKRKKTFDPPIDGFICGFGWFFGILNLARTIPVST